MVRALLDANVLISAVIRPSGPPGQIIATLLTQSFDLILSPGIIDGVEIALALPKMVRLGPARKFPQPRASSVRRLQRVFMMKTTDDGS